MLVARAQQTTNWSFCGHPLLPGVGMARPRHGKIQWPVSTKNYDYDFLRPITHTQGRVTRSKHGKILVYNQISHRLIIIIIVLILNGWNLSPRLGDPHWGWQRIFPSLPMSRVAAGWALAGLL